MAQVGRGAAALQQHGAEEAGDDEEHRHPECMDGHRQQVRQGRGAVVAHRQVERHRHVVHGHVQHDAQPHHDGPQVVQRVVAGFGIGHTRDASKVERASQGPSGGAGRSVSR